MQEDGEAGVAESWQEIIFRVHQPPAQSAEEEAQHGGESGLLWARAESTGESSHVCVPEIGCEIVSDLFNSRWYKYRVTSVEEHV